MLFRTAGQVPSISGSGRPARTRWRLSSRTMVAACRWTSAGARSIRSSRRVVIREAQGSACTSFTASSPIDWAAVSAFTRSPVAARESGSCCLGSARWSRPRSSARLIGIGQFAQRRREDLTGFAYQRGTVHDTRGIREGAGYTDTDRVRPAKKRTLMGAAGMTLDQHLALERVALRRVAAGVEKIRIAAEDFPVAEHDHAAALAGSPVLQADMDRIEAVLHVEYVFRGSPAWRLSAGASGQAYFLSRSKSSTEMP